MQICGCGDRHGATEPHDPVCHDRAHSGQLRTDPQNIALSGLNVVY